MHLFHYKNCIFVSKKNVADFIDITDWKEKKFFQTRGTRDKCIVENPDDLSLYYFKTSINIGEKNYKYEFWSEIVASYVGSFLGFKTLKYDIARKGEKIGCISKAMNSKTSTLTEGISFLTGYDNTYKPAEKSSYSDYTLEFILNSLKAYNLESQIPNFYKTLIFDFIIGNSDRHQENWGFISEVDHTWKHKLYIFLKTKGNIKKIISRIIPGKAISKISKSFVSHFSNEFSPIYDSGCSFAREKSDDEVEKMLKDESLIKNYINRGKSEIRNENGDKYKHIELLQVLLTKDYEFISSVIKDVLNRFDEDEIKKIVNEIDMGLPKEFDRYALPEYRKQLINKILILKINELKSLL